MDEGDLGDDFADGRGGILHEHSLMRLGGEEKVHFVGTTLDDGMVLAHVLDGTGVGLRLEVLNVLLGVELVDRLDIFEVEILIDFGSAEGPLEVDVLGMGFDLALGTSGGVLNANHDAILTNVDVVLAGRHVLDAAGGNPSEDCIPDLVVLLILLLKEDKVVALVPMSANVAQGFGDLTGDERKGANAQQESKDSEVFFHNYFNF